MTAIEPRRGQIIQEVMAKIPGGVPVVMVNMLKFREKAVYAEGPSELSGREAYARYSRSAVKHVGEVGGEVIWYGTACASVIAPPEENWDEIFLVRYPSIQAFKEMIARPSYQEIVIHRSAALENSRLIATVAPNTAGRSGKVYD